MIYDNMPYANTNFYNNIYYTNFYNNIYYTNFYNNIYYTILIFIN